MSEAMLTAIGTAVTAVQTDAMSVLSTILPVALALAGVIWVARRVFRWFRGMTGGQ